MVATLPFVREILQLMGGGAVDGGVPEALLHAMCGTEIARIDNVPQLEELRDEDLLLAIQVRKIKCLSPEPPHTLYQESGVFPLISPCHVIMNRLSHAMSGTGIAVSGTDIVESGTDMVLSSTALQSPGTDVTLT